MKQVLYFIYSLLEDMENTYPNTILSFISYFFLHTRITNHLNYCIFFFLALFMDQAFCKAFARQKSGQDLTFQEWLCFLTAYYLVLEFSASLFFLLYRRGAIFLVEKITTSSAKKKKIITPLTDQNPIFLQYVNDRIELEKWDVAEEIPTSLPPKKEKNITSPTNQNPIFLRYVNERIELD